MRVISTLLFLISLTAFGVDAPEQSPRLMVHLLDYIGLDYSGAVKDGKILAESEYKEQLEFAQTRLDRPAI